MKRKRRKSNNNLEIMCLWEKTTKQLSPKKLPKRTREPNNQPTQPSKFFILKFIKMEKK